MEPRRSSAPARINSAAEERERNEKHIRPFDRSLPMQLLRAREAVMQHFRPHLRGHGITEQQWRVLRVLAEARLLEILEISERCCILPASLSLMLPKLEAAGLISRQNNPADQRRVNVSLTANGRNFFAKMSVESEKAYAELARDVGGERSAALTISSVKSRLA
jgi:homoprotocatechuate degradation regulator HpaR